MNPKDVPDVPGLPSSLEGLLSLDAEESESETTSGPSDDESDTEDEEPAPPKKRKRGRSKKAQTEGGATENSGGTDAYITGDSKAEGEQPSNDTKSGGKWKKEKNFDRRGPKGERIL